MTEEQLFKKLIRSDRETYDFCTAAQQVEIKKLFFKLVKELGRLPNYTIINNDIDGIVMHYGSMEITVVLEAIWGDYVCFQAWTDDENVGHIDMAVGPRGKVTGTWDVLSLVMGL